MMSMFKESVAEIRYCLSCEVGFIFDGQVYCRKCRPYAIETKLDADVKDLKQMSFDFEGDG